MTARYLMMLALSLGVGAFAAGCSGGGDDGGTKTDGDDDDDDDDDDSCGTGTAPCRDTCFDARQIQVYGQFGYDSVNRVTGTVDLAGYAQISPTYEIYLAEASWQGDLQDTGGYCYIVMPLDNAVNSATATADPRLYWGAQYNPAVDAPLSNCHTPGWELCVDTWGDDVVRDFVGYYGDSYFVAVGDPSETVANDLIPQFGADAIYVIGGALGVPEWLPTDTPGQVDDAYGFAWTTDANLVVQLDANMYLQPLESQTVNVGGNIATAWYELYSCVYWSLQ